MAEKKTITVRLLQNHMEMETDVPEDVVVILKDYDTMHEKEEPEKGFKRDERGIYHETIIEHDEYFSSRKR